MASTASAQQTTGSMALGDVLTLGANYLDSVVATSPAAASDPTLADTSVAAIAALRAVIGDINNAIVPATVTPPGETTPIYLPNAGKPVGQISIDELATMVEAASAFVAADPRANPTGLALLNLARSALKAVTVKLQQDPSLALTYLPPANPNAPLAVPTPAPNTVRIARPLASVVRAQPLGAGFAGYPYAFQY